MLKNILPAREVRFLSNKNVVDYLDCVLAMAGKLEHPARMIDMTLGILYGRGPIKLTCHE